MKHKTVFVSIVIIASISWSCSTPSEECPTCPPTPEPDVILQEVTVEVPSECPELVCPETQCPECPSGPTELGPWTVQSVIDTPGQYLVPEEMEPGQWAYQAEDPSDTCWVTTYSDLSGSNESILDNFYSANKGFFVLKENVRMAEIEDFGPCTYSRIGE